eukprot:m.145782 g.145782  ORF g.145782 m.145782 type:complete len:402 (+) comp10084_c0_seq4:79-1284(+)
MDAVEEATWEHWAATEVINFGIGQPDEALLPREMLAEAAAAQLGSGSGGAPTPSFLNYAAYVGPRSFVNTLASFLTTALGESVASEELFTTNGCSQAIEFVTLQLAPPGSCVFIEEPTYFLVHNIFRDCHVNPVAVPLGPDGSLDLDALEALLKEHQPRLLYTVPTFSNPCAATHPLHTRNRLVALAAKHDFVILADEVYQLLYFDDADRPPAPYYHCARALGLGQYAVSLGTFSKIIGPGLRLGWLQADPVLRRKLASRGYVASGGGLNPLVSILIEHPLRTGAVADHIEWVRGEYAKRAAALTAALNKHRPADMPEVSTPKGGYFIWIELPPGVSATQLIAEYAPKFNVRAHAGPRFSLTADAKFEHFVRLSFAFYDAERLAEGAQRLCAAISAAAASQ